MLGKIFPVCAGVCAAVACTSHHSPFLFGFSIAFDQQPDAEEEVFECDCLLNATGRVPNVFGIGLDEANVDFNNRQGVVIDDFFRFVVSCVLSLFLNRFAYSGCIGVVFSNVALLYSTTCCLCMSHSSSIESTKD